MRTFNALHMKKSLALLVATAALLVGSEKSIAQTHPPAWKASEAEFINGRKRFGAMDYVGARQQFVAAWKTLEENPGWSPEWGSRVAWETGVAIAYTCRDYEAALRMLEIAREQNDLIPVKDEFREGRIVREAARVAYQAGRFELAAQSYITALSKLEPAYQKRSPLLVAGLLEEASPAWQRGGDPARAEQARIRAAEIRSQVPPNPLMNSAYPPLQQSCGEPR
jgi:tetratricopeptide (TPR) repeat protein